MRKREKEFHENNFMQHGLINTNHILPKTPRNLGVVWFENSVWCLVFLYVFNVFIFTLQKKKKTVIKQTSP